MKFWKTINDILGQDLNVRIAQVFQYNTNILCEESEAADVIKKIFASVGERITESIMNLDYSHEA